METNKTLNLTPAEMACTCGNSACAVRAGNGLLPFCALRRFARPGHFIARAAGGGFEYRPTVEVPEWRSKDAARAANPGKEVYRFRSLGNGFSFWRVAGT
jgi:hypothetical protein